MLGRAVLVFAASLLLMGAGDPTVYRLEALPTQVDIDGVGSIKFGMTLAEVEKLGGKLVFDHPEEPVNQCTFGRPKSEPTLGFMLMHRVIVRADVFEGTIKTAEGAGIGTSEDEVKRIYANAKVEASNHAYVDGHYLEVTMPGHANLRYIFETDGKKVTAFRAGRLPEVGYIEGCA